VAKFVGEGQGVRGGTCFPGVLSSTPLKYLTIICAAEARSSGLMIAIYRIFETESTFEAVDETA